MPTSSQVVTSSLPTAFETYYTQPDTGLIAQASKLYGAATPADFAAKYVLPAQAANLYGTSRIAELQPYQTQVGTELGKLTTPSQFGAGTQAAQAGISSLTGLQGFTPQTVSAPSLQQYQMGPGLSVSGQTFMSPEMAAAQTRFDPNLQRFQMEAPETVSAQALTTPQMRAAQAALPQTFGMEQARQYMSPYMQEVVDVQKREAIRDAQKAQLAQNLGAARQGTYGGARQLLATTERERALGTQLGDIQTRGLEAAFQQAQQQFERDRAAGLQVGLANLNTAQQAEVQNQAAALQTQGLSAQQAMQAALANQQSRQSAAQANLQAALGVQQLGTQTGMQTALANLSAQERANVQNQAAMLQTQGLNAQQAMQAALANQQAGLTVGQQNLQALLGVQQLGAGQSMEAQRANQVAALQAAQVKQQAAMGLGALGQQLGQLGVAQQAADIDRLKTLGAYGDLQRALEQQKLDVRYQDLMRGVEFPESQLAAMSGFLRGIPLTDTTTTTTTTPPSFASQLAGLGLSGLSLYRLLNPTG